MTTERRNITQPADWWAAFEKQAENEGNTLSCWIGECCLAFLEKQDLDKLCQRPPAHRPKAEKPLARRR